MVDLPQANWAVYEARSRASDAAWVRSLTPSDRFTLYQDLLSVIQEGRRNLGNWERLERWNWRQKVTLRLRLVEAFTKLDQIGRERAASNNAG